MQLIVDQSLATRFIPINTLQQRASLPFKPGQVHHLQVKMGSLSVTEDLRRYIKPWSINRTNFVETGYNYIDLLKQFY